MAVDRASDNPFPSILMVEGDPEDLASNPATGQRRLAVGTDHILYLVDDSGVKHAVGAVPDAEDVSVTPFGSIAATNVQDALEEIIAEATGFTDPMTTRGDIIVRNSSNATARLAVGATSGMVLRSDGTDPSWKRPPGYEWDYAEITSAASITASTAGTANTVVSGNSVTYDGEAVIVTISAPWMQTGTGGNEMVHLLYMDGSNLAEMGREYTNLSWGPHAQIKMTPSAGAHTFSWRCYTNGNTGTRQVNAGTGTSGAYRPAYIRVTKA